VAEIPDVLLGVLRKGNYIESLEAIRDRIGAELEAGYCDECGREGPRDAKDTAALLLRLTETLKLIEAGAGAPVGASLAGPQAMGTVSSISSIQARSREARRTGAGTQSTGAPTSVAKRSGPRRPGAGRKPAAGG
jgi:hypothetical protein